MLEEWEAEIDDRVANLYGLTAEEMKTIRAEVLNVEKSQKKMLL